MSLKTTIVQPGMFKAPPFSLPVTDHPVVEGETVPRRNAKFVYKLLARPDDGTRTLYDVLVRSAAKFGDLDTMGTRKLIQKHVENKIATPIVEGGGQAVEKTWTFFEMGPYEYATFGGYFERAIQIGAGYRKLGLGRGDRVHIFAAKSANWLAAAHGAVTQSMPIVTSYATLGEEGLEMSLVQSHAKVIFVDPDLLSKLVKPLSKAKALDWVVYNDQHEISQEDVKALRDAYPRITIIPLEHLRAMGERSPVKAVPPQPEDLCCLMFTSGTTGAPKGVPLKHRNVVASTFAGLESIFAEYVSPSDSVLAYLPLAHSFEFAFENACLYWGVKMGYGSPRTISDLSMRNCRGDIKEFRPTILVGVPAVWETIRKGIEIRVARMGMVGSSVFWSALRAKTWCCQKGLVGLAGWLDWAVFDKIKDETGGRLRACFNGAGPLGRETRRFISYALVPLISGYGLTETCAMGALQDPLEWTDDTLGDIPSSIEIKLIDFADAGYFANNDPPRGEILIRGDPVMEGYYENEAETAEAMAPGGWFRTGDIGEWAPSGHLKIIDRKKNLVKTLNGEYIALEKLESIYRSSPLISNLCVYASASAQKPLAIAIPAPVALQRVAQETGIEGKTYEQLVHDVSIKQLVLKELQRTGRKAGLASFEILEAVVLTDDEWTPVNGFLTAAQKLSRRTIVGAYQTEIDEVYGRGL